MASNTWRPLPWRRKAFAADPEELVFVRLFRRLFFWYGSLLAVFIILLGLSIGTTVPWLVYVASEHALSGQVAQLAQNWQAAPDSPCSLTLPGKGYMLACYDAQGRLLKSLGVKG